MTTELLRSLSEEEWAAFELFLQSPYFNRGVQAERILRVYGVLRSAGGDLPDKAALAADIFVGTPAAPWVNMGNSNANAPFTYTFAGMGIYQVCRLVERTTSEGEVCSREVCVFVNVFAQLRDDPGEMVSIAPNPFDGELFVTSLTPETTQIEVGVRDLFGKELLRFRKDELRVGEAWPLDLTGLAAGVYLLECNGGGRKQVLRVVKQ
ncbi:MAG TPA: T9SS type A sorting domain-containing protein [Saprospiraceae bacterium]|nr:T9SS type A sorting domain-containing protein [Saprospiraceae bacterium]